MKDDTISRQAAIDAIKMYSVKCPEYMSNWGNKLIDSVKQDIEDDIMGLPSASTELSNNSPKLDNKNGELISRQDAIDSINAYLGLSAVSRTIQNMTSIQEILEKLPSAQPERTCVNCGRTANNGGWYADGRTRCPIEEHYALPKDGYCHLWEKRNVTDDDYPERRTDE